MGQCVGKERKRRESGQIELTSSPPSNSSNLSESKKNNGPTADGEPAITPKKKSPRKGSSKQTSPPPSASINDNSNGPSAGDEKSKSKKKKETAYARKNVEKLFDKYKETAESTEGASATDMDPAIGPEGIERLCRDIGIDADDVVLLVLSYHLSASEMGYFYRDEWINGLEKLKIDTIDKLKNHVQVMRDELNDPEKLKTIYRWLFGFAKATPEQKCVDIDTAIGILNLILAPRFSHVRHFVEFLQAHPGSVKGLNLDQWTSLYEFAVTVQDDFSNYDENGAWPCVMDEYVQWKMGKGEGKTQGEESTDSF